MTQPIAERSRTEQRSGRLWMTICLAGLAGLGFTGTQIMEKLTILKDPTATLVCDVNGVLSCTDVLRSRQASVLGPPNALIGAVTLWSCGVSPSSSWSSRPGSCSRAPSASAGPAGRMLEVAVRSGLDLIVWFGWWLAIGAVLSVGLCG
jgi:hypothetical protein